MYIAPNTNIRVLKNVPHNEGWGFAVGEMRTEETYVYSTKH
nr:MAG TPA: hypothetical protein [Caudoviricetes sp.]